jgi:putative transposase
MIDLTTAPGQAQLTERIKEISATRVRSGYRRRVHLLLRREGWRVNSKQVCRLYREMGLQLRNKTPKRRVKAKLHEDRQSATRPNETWATGALIDTFSRFLPAIEPRETGLTSKNEVRFSAIVCT